MTDRLIRSSGRMRPRPTGHRYAVALTVDGPDGIRIVTATIGEYSVHQAMRRVAREADLAPGETVIGTTGARLTAKRSRGRRTLPTMAEPTDWDAIESGRHGLSYVPNR